MKKSIIVICFLLFITVDLLSKCNCYYFDFDNDFTINTCKYYSKVFNCSINNLNDFDINKTYDTLIIVGFGSYKGLIISNYDWNNYDNLSVIKWEDLAKVEANLFIIDSCYSGYIFNYKWNAKYLVTTTYKENSWNIIDDYGNNISSFSAILRCFYDNNYKCPIDCDIDISTCQLKLILWSIINNWGYKTTVFYDWEYPSIGTCIINNKPCKNIK